MLANKHWLKCICNEVSLHKHSYMHCASVLHFCFVVKVATLNFPFCLTLFVDRRSPNTALQHIRPASVPSPCHTGWDPFTPRLTHTCSQHPWLYAPCRRIFRSCARWDARTCLAIAPHNLVSFVFRGGYTRKGCRVSCSLQGENTIRSTASLHGNWEHKNVTQSKNKRPLWTRLYTTKLTCWLLLLRPCPGIPLCPRCKNKWMEAC